MKHLVLALFSIILWQGCASLSKEECQVGNWFEYGRRDGSKGTATDALASHQKACADYGVSPDKTEYLKGHNEGLKSYCTFENGKVLGERGRTDIGVCVGAHAREFSKGLGEGKKIYDINRKIADLEKKISELNSQIKTLDGEITIIEQKRLATTNIETYKLAEYELRDKNAVKTQVQGEIKKLEKQKAELEDTKFRL